MMQIVRDYQSTDGDWYYTNCGRAECLAFCCFYRVGDLPNNYLHTYRVRLGHLAKARDKIPEVHNDRRAQPQGFWGNL